MTGVIFLAFVIIALVIYFLYERAQANAALDRELGNEYRATVAIKAGSRGYFRECEDGRFKWVRI